MKKYLLAVSRSSVTYVVTTCYIFAVIATMLITCKAITIEQGLLGLAIASLMIVLFATRYELRAVREVLIARERKLGG